MSCALVVVVSGSINGPAGVVPVPVLSLSLSLGLRMLMQSLDILGLVVVFSSILCLLRDDDVFWKVLFWGVLFGDNRDHGRFYGCGGGGGICLGSGGLVVSMVLLPFRLPPLVGRRRLVGRLLQVQQQVVLQVRQRW